MNGDAGAAPRETAQAGGGGRTEVGGAENHLGAGGDSGCHGGGRRVVAASSGEGSVQEKTARNRTLPWGRLHGVGGRWEEELWGWGPLRRPAQQIHRHVLQRAENWFRRTEPFVPWPFCPPPPIGHSSHPPPRPSLGTSTQRTRTTCTGGKATGETWGTLKAWTDQPPRAGVHWHWELTRSPRALDT